MKPKIIQVRGVAIEKKFNSIDNELLNILKNIHNGDWKVTNELNFLDAYKSNKRGAHFDIYLGDIGTIIFRPFNYVDGLDNWCYFNLKEYSKDNRHVLEFYQWSSVRECKMDMWFNGEELVTASQKKSTRIRGDKTLIKKKDLYESTNYYVKLIVGLSVEDLTGEHKIYRCER
jgi:hypothetical protein